MTDSKTPIDIKAITPGVFDTSYLRGIVSLRWPYSSSQHTISIQLADEDIRRRSDKGQIKLTFHGSAALHIKDLPSLTLLEITATSNDVNFLKSTGSTREADYSITFTGSVDVKTGDGAFTTFDSTQVAPDSTPARVKRTWITQELKRSTPTDEIGLEEAWFSDVTPEAKRKRYSSTFKFINSTQATPSKSPRASPFGDENDLSSQTFSPMPSFQSSGREFEQQQPNSQVDFQFQTPFAPVRFEVASRSFSEQDISSQNNAEPPSSLGAQGILSSTAPPFTVATTNLPHIEDDLQSHGQTSRASSVHGEASQSGYELQGTPRTAPSVHFDTINQGSAPPTPRNVPYMSLESASEQEDLYRKLRASAPPKSDAGSSMVGVEDDETGNLAEDPKPTILETQSRVQEGILRRKISDDDGDSRTQSNNAREAQDSVNEDTALFGSTGNNDSVRESRGALNNAQARSTTAAYGNSLDGGELGANSQDNNEQRIRLRETSPSMTERGAAVQESVFRSKIRSSDSDMNDHHSTRSIKSSIFVEPAAASTDDGSVHENVEETMLDRQASVQETLFRAKLNLPDVRIEEAGNLSTTGQAPAPSSNGDVEVVNAEPTMMQQQNDVQENIFRDKVQGIERDQIPRAGPASLEHMEVNETANTAHLIQDRPLRLPVQLFGGSDISALDQPEAPLSTQLDNSYPLVNNPSARNDFNQEPDISEAPENMSVDSEIDARTLLQISLTAEPVGELASDPSPASYSSNSEEPAMLRDATILRSHVGGADSSPIVIESDDESLDSRTQSSDSSAGQSSDDSKTPSQSYESTTSPHSKETTEIQEQIEDNQDMKASTSLEDDDASITSDSASADLEAAFIIPGTNSQEQTVSNPEFHDITNDATDKSTESVNDDSEALSDVLDRHEQLDAVDDVTHADTENDDGDFTVFSPEEDVDYEEFVNDEEEDDNESVLAYPPSESLLAAEYHTQVIDDMTGVGSEESGSDADVEYSGPSLAQMLSRDGLGDDDELDEDELHHDQEDEVAEDEKMLAATAPEAVLAAIDRHVVPEEVHDESVSVDAPTGSVTVVNQGTTDEEEQQRHITTEDSIQQRSASSIARSEQSSGHSSGDEVTAQEHKDVIQPETHKKEQNTLAKSPTPPPAVISPSSQLLTETSFYECMKTLALDKVVDVLGVVYHAKTRKTKGPDYAWTASIMQSTGVSRRISIFRPFRSSLPDVTDGDVLLLRNFKVLSFARELYLKSQEDSAWSSFRSSSDAREPMIISIPGPPVEYSDAEVVHAQNLSQWWTIHGHKLVPDPPTPRSTLSLHQIRKDLFFDMKGELIIKPSAMATPYIIYVTDYSRVQDSKVIGEVDILSSLGLEGENADCLYLPVELRLQDARYVHSRVNVGDNIALENVLASLGTDGKLYGLIRPELSGDIHVHRLKSEDGSI